MNSVFRSTLFLILFTVAYGAQQQSAVTKEIDQETKKAGSVGQLNCTVTNPMGFIVFWKQMLDGGSSRSISSNTDILLRNIDIGNGELKYEVRMIRSAGGNTIYQLIVRALREEDAGTYRCQINVPDILEQPYRDGLLVVQRSPKIDEAQTSKGPIYMKEGASYNLTCFAEGIPKPKITWTRVKGTTLQSTGQEIKAKGNVLTLRNISYDHRGVYRCNADNNVRPPVQQDIEVTVYFRPVSRAFRASVGQMPDKNYKAELDCLVEGFPEPDIRWYSLKKGTKHRVQVLKDSNHDIFETTAKGSSEMKEGDKWSTLVVKNVQSGDYGQYTCEGSSQLGSDGVNIKLYYTPTCQGALCPMENLKTTASSMVASSLLLISSFISFQLLSE